MIVMISMPTGESWCCVPPENPGPFTDLQHRPDVRTSGNHVVRWTEDQVVDLGLRLDLGGAQAGALFFRLQHHVLLLLVPSG
ncbi:MAG: hypothetical protein ACRDQ4_18675 [Pseudonocardiaceae bacterium]